MATKKLAHPHPVIIGRAEPISFVGYKNLEDMPAKVDTGAYRSAIHADNIYVDNAGRLHFTLFQGHPICGKYATEMVSDTFSRASISSSFGDMEERYEVVLKVKIGPKVFRESFSLADRAKMIYPILLGRKLLNNRFFVDPSTSGISRKNLKTKYNISLPADEEGIYENDSE